MLRKRKLSENQAASLHMPIWLDISAAYLNLFLPTIGRSKTICKNLSHPPVTIYSPHAYYVNVDLYIMLLRRDSMSNMERGGCTHDCTLLFFILVFLLLFYDNSALGILSTGRRGINTCTGDDTLLFFILVFLKLFY